MSQFRHWAVVLLLVGIQAPASGQQAGSRELGRSAGRAAAEGVSVAPVFVVGMVGGVPLGIGGAHYLGSDGNEAGPTPVIAGAGILVGGTIGIHLFSDAPPPRYQALGPDSDQYQLGFREGYESRLRSRRRNAMALGGVVGVAAGALAYSYLRNVGR